MTTLNELGQVDEGHLLVALRAQCAVADSNQPELPNIPTTFPPIPTSNIRSEQSIRRLETSNGAPGPVQEEPAARGGPSSINADPASASRWSRAQPTIAGLPVLRSNLDSLSRTPRWHPPHPPSSAGRPASRRYSAPPWHPANPT